MCFAPGLMKNTLGPKGIRTHDLSITSRMLYQLSNRPLDCQTAEIFLSTQTDASYTISNISLEFDTVTNTSLASQIRTEYMKSSTLYDRILRVHIIPLNDSSTSFSVDINSLRGVLLIFMKE